MLKKLPLKFIILVSRSLLDCYSLFQNDNSWDSFFSFESRGFKLKYRANLIEIRIIYQFFIFNSRTVMVHCCQIVCIIEIDIGDIYIYGVYQNGIYCQLPNLFQITTYCQSWKLQQLSNNTIYSYNMIYLIIALKHFKKNYIEIVYIGIAFVISITDV